LRPPIIFLNIALTVVSAQASASDLESRLLKCRPLSSVASRVNCYDQIADSYTRRDEVAQTQEVQSSVQAPVVISTTVHPKPHPEPTTPATSTDKAIQPEELFGKPEKTVNEIVKKKLEIRAINQIRSPVVKVQQNHAKEFIVLLENGQTWKQKGDGGSWRISKGEVAVISKALFGSFLMRVEGRKKSIRAVRVN